MTIEETRQLGIEFERRIHTLIPESELAQKLDTETIYSYLNQYQDKYVHTMYRQLDNVQSDTRLSAHVESVLQSMIASYNVSAENGKESFDGIHDANGISIVDTARSLTFRLPTDFYMYIRSVSNVSSTFSFVAGTHSDTATRVIPNKLVNQTDVWKLIETPNDSLRILRYPAVVLNQYETTPTITVIYDQYTTIKGLRILYYKEPAHFDLFTSTPCELPMDSFDDLVTGAVDLYISYAAGAEARKRQMNQQANGRNSRQ